MAPICVLELITQVRVFSLYTIDSSVSKWIGRGPEFDSWQRFLPTIPDRVETNPNTDPIDTDTVARYLFQENG